jgi:malonyl-CoA O-methyltransferase
VAGVPLYPALDDLRGMLARFGDAFMFDEDIAIGCRDARGLLAHLRGIGAVVPGEGRAPLSVGELRRVMAAFDADGGQDGYQLLFGRVTRRA